MFIFEDGFDFKSELLKEDTNESVCLISGAPLLNPIKLSCGHEFNFEPLFKEVFNQKINPHFKNDVQLKVSQFKCPYCRKIQNKLLPDKDFKIFKVTTVDSDYEVYPCMFFNTMYDLGNCSVPYCTKKYVVTKGKLKLCCIHDKITNKEKLHLEKINKYIQLYPNETMENIIIKIEIDKQLTALNAAKLKEEKAKAKEEKAKAKEEKAKAKEEKAKAKEEKAKVKEEKKKIAEEKAKAKEEKKKIAEEKKKIAEEKAKSKEKKIAEKAKEIH